MAYPLSPALPCQTDLMLRLFVLFVRSFCSRRDLLCEYSVV